MKKRKAIPVDIKQQLLHESGYICSNPGCRDVLTLEMHHLDYVSEGGGNTPDNLLALCVKCHTLHHLGHIPISSLRTWKFLLLSLNEAFDKSAINILLTLNKIGKLRMPGSGVLMCASLIASGYVEYEYKSNSGLWGGETDECHFIELTEKGKSFVEGWINGDQEKALTKYTSS